MRSIGIRYPSGGDTRWTDDSPAGALLRSAFFGPTQTGRVSVWDGAAWALRPLSVWTGTAWQVTPVRYWDGAAWRVGA